MSLLLRIEMIAAALAVVFIVVRNVNLRKMRIQYSFIWLLIAAALVVVAFFPGTVITLCGLMGIQTPVNLIYLFGIFTLLLITFYQTILLSRQADQIARLTQIVSIETFLAGEREEPHEEANDGGVGPGA